MSYEKTQNSVRSMFASIATKYDLTNTVLSFGVHLLWKKKFISLLPSLSNPENNEAKILDLCTGTGDLVPLLQQKYPGAKVIGGDFCEPMLEVARKRFSQSSFELCDAQAMQYPSDYFDRITDAYGVRNFEDLQKGLSEMFRTLKPDGVVAILEFGQPTNPILAKVYSLYSQFILPVVGFLITGDRNAYAYLNKTSLTFPCGDAFVEILKEVGFREVQVKKLLGGVSYIYVGKKKCVF